MREREARRCPVRAVSGPRACHGAPREGDRVSGASGGRGAGARCDRGETSGNDEAIVPKLVNCPCRIASARTSTRDARVIRCITAESGCTVESPSWNRCTIDPEMSEGRSGDPASHARSLASRTADRRGSPRGVARRAWRASRWRASARRGSARRTRTAHARFVQTLREAARRPPAWCRASRCRHGIGAEPSV